MNTITPEQAVANFKGLKTLLLASAASQKSIDFCNSVFAKIEARGKEWMATNAAALEIKFEFDSVEDDARSPAPVKDNRAFFMQKLQLALLQK